MPPSPEPLCACCRQRPAVPAHHPFCSARCRLSDLSRWIDGSYRIRGEPVDKESPPAADADERP